MDYFRRPQLAGKNLVRTQMATVTGSVRRADADGTSTDPYFPTITGVFPQAGSLTFKIDGVTKTVTLTSSNKFADVLADIRTAMGSSGTVTDTDGSITIRTATLGGTGSVEITGGTWAAALGFDISKYPIKSIGGDLPSTPEGRKGNPFGAAFPGRGEDLTIESLQRSLGRLSSNADVLHAEQNKQNAVLHKIPFTIDVSRAFITPSSGLRLYTGAAAGINPFTPLKQNAIRDYLSSFYFLLDADTHQPAPSRIIGVTRGAPSGSSYLANASSWTDTTGKNVLGQDLVKMSCAISSISEGRFVTCNSATFITSGVVEGDLVNLVGATNTIPWSNNGYRWVIESVISETTLELRPMSYIEVNQVGSFLPDTQPIVELNGEPTGSLGTVYIHTGFGTSDVCLVCDPPLLPNANYELWAALATKSSDEKGWESLNGNFPAALHLGSNLDLLPNGVLSRPVVTVSGGNYNYTAFYARWHGKVIHIPAGFVAKTATAGVPEYIYWDEKTAHVLTSTTSMFNGSPAQQDPSASGTTTQGHLLYWFLDPGSSPTLYPATKLEDTTAKTSVTVGHGGQFADLQEAMNHIKALMAVNLESFLASGSYSHFDVTVVSDLTISSTINVPYMVRIRGSHPGINLKYTGSVGTSMFKTEYAFELENITFGGDTVGYDLIYSTGDDVDHVYLRNLQQAAGTGTLSTLLKIEGNIFYVGLDRCNVSPAGGLVWGSVDERIEVSSCYVQSGGSSPSMINAFSGTGGNRVVHGIIRDCRFEPLSTTSAVVPMLLDVDTTNYFNSCTWIISGNIFAFSTVPGTGSTLIQAGSGTIFFSENTVEARSASTAVASAIMNSSGNVHIQNSRFNVQPVNLRYGVQATTITGSTINLVDPSVSGHVNSTGLLVTRAAYGNTITGACNHAIETQVTGGADIRGNYVELSIGTNTGAPQRIIRLKGSNSTISGNYLSTPGGVGIESSGATSYNTIESNRIVSSGSPTNGILLTNSSNYEIINNYISGVLTGYTGIYISEPDKFVIRGNEIQAGPDATGKGIDLPSIGTGRTVTLSDNKITAYAPVTNPNSNVTITASGNQFIGELTANMIGEFRGNSWTGNVAFTGDTSVVDSMFNQSSGDTTCLVSIAVPASKHGEFSFNRLINGTRLEVSGDVTSSLNITDNYIDQSVSVTSGANLGDVSFVGNNVGNGIDLSPSSGDKSAVLTGNVITGLATIGTKIKHLTMDNCEMNGSLTRVTPSTGGSTRIGNTKVTSNMIIQGGGVTFSNNYVGGYARISGGVSYAALPEALVTNSHFNVGFEFEGYVSVSNCYIGSGISLISGTAFSRNTLLLAGSTICTATNIANLESFRASQCNFLGSLTVAYASGYDFLVSISDCRLNTLAVNYAKRCDIVNSSVTNSTVLSATGYGANVEHHIRDSSLASLWISGGTSYISNTTMGDTTVHCNASLGRSVSINNSVFGYLTLDGASTKFSVSDCTGINITVPVDCNSSSIKGCTLTAGSISNVLHPCIDILMVSGNGGLVIANNDLKTFNDIAGNTDVHSISPCIRLGNIGGAAIERVQISDNIMFMQDSSFIPVTLAKVGIWEGCISGIGAVKHCIISNNIASSYDYANGYDTSWYGYFIKLATVTDLYFAGNIVSTIGTSSFTARTSPGSQGGSAYITGPTNALMGN